jgi:integrase
MSAGSSGPCGRTSPRSTVHHSHWQLATVLRAVMGRAARRETHAPGPRPGKGAPARIVPMTTAQVRAVLEAPLVRYRITALLGAGCSLRIGEVLGLRVRSVDFLDGGLASVSSSSCWPGRRVSGSA